jgi:hypothetical protein
MTATVPPEAVMAWAIMAARRSNKKVLIENVSGLFAKLRQANVEEVGRVALRQLPHGLYSEDVEVFFGHLLALGYAKAQSPLEVNDKGEKLCQELLEEENAAHPEALRKIANVLDLDLDLLNSPTHP